MSRVPAAERRQAFIAAAIEVIAEHGVAGATTRRIAEVAEAPLATLHYCFQTKENLMLAAFEAEGEHFADFIGADEADGLAEAAPLVLRAAVAWFAEHPQFARSQSEMFNWAIRQTDPPDLGRRLYDPFIEGIATYLRRSMAPGDDPALADPLARLITALLDGFVFQGLAYPDPEYTRANVDLAAEMVALTAARGSRALRPAGEKD
jgi:TetR/AcrR family transcriptional regulator, regulator of biofilm formation and stress response